MNRTRTIFLYVICWFIFDVFECGSSRNFSLEYLYIKEQTKKPKKKRKIIYVDATCYHPVKEQCNGDPLRTADNSKIDLKKLKRGELKWIAVSRDLEKHFPMGSKVRVHDEKTGKCWGVYTVHDRMNRRFKKRIDILKHPSDKKLFFESNIGLTKL